MSLYKNFNITKNLEAQFRIEVFNLFDEENYTGVNTVLSPTSVTYDTGDPATATTIVDYTIPNTFGQATGARDPRQIQLGLKIFF